MRVAIVAVIGCLVWYSLWRWLKHGQGVVFEHYYIKWEESIH